MLVDILLISAVRIATVGTNSQSLGSHEEQTVDIKKHHKISAAFQMIYWLMS